MAAPPVNRGQPGSKHHLLLDAGGLPVAVRVSGGNRHDVTQLPLIQQVQPSAAARVGRCGAPRQLLGDRTYDSGPHRHVLRLVASDLGWPDAGYRTARGWEAASVERSFA